MKVFAVVMICLTFLSAAAAPSRQGKPEIRTYTHTVAYFLEFVCTTVLAGRVLGWW